jgi:hypothetical protein
MSPDEGLLGESPRRAELDTLTAAVAARILPLAEFRRDKGMLAPVNETQHRFPLDLLAGPHAAFTADTLFRIVDQYRRRFVLRQAHISEDGGKCPVLCYPELIPICEILEPALSVSVTDGTVVVMLGQEELEGGATGGLYLFIEGGNLHSLLHLGGTRGNEASPPFDLHHAEAAGTVGTEAGMIAELRYADPVIQSGLKEIVSSMSDDFFSVDRASHRITHEATPVYAPVSAGHAGIKYSRTHIKSKGEERRKGAAAALLPRSPFDCIVQRQEEKEMARIKSAWEIALERTSEIEGNKESIRVNALKKAGRKIASEYINADSSDLLKLTDSLKSYSKEERREVEKSVIEVLFAQISLPRNEQFKEKLEESKKALSSLSKNGKKVSAIIDEIAQFFRQYLEYREQIRERLTQQYGPQLKQKEEQLSHQYGYSVELRPEQDPEFNQLLKRNFQRLEEQYQEALDRAREELRTYFLV